MGFFDKIKAGLTRTKDNISNIGHSFDQLFAGELDDDFYDELEETLILSDMGVETAMKAVEELRRRAKAEKIKNAEEGRECLRAILTEFLEVGDLSLKLDTKPSVALFIGVNGVGKTTTIGKLSAHLKGEGRRVLMAAADTFRAAAADQLEIWSQRCGVDIVRQHEGADPAAVVFDALSAAKARGTDVVLVDTAGRLHNKQNLMNELNKISRILDRELPGADRETLLVLDATTGQNGLIQAKQFKEAAGITGIVLTKLDGSAKGGIVIAIAQELGVPVKFIGVGEGIDDLMPFEPAEFVKAFV
ncbi:signal recognition particle-docking protein FtsY [Pseudoflavonifractor hominis]|uniref:Signal recognition particle receptor FtsY n=1 Tax=Pseudoflavonifractor hominis TaxID=2763059 RepID=A0ABR7HQC1_9FIRM|nr:signal recognition particle-docking protein FtsY [Pseudoflavonifractor hominis]MBC5729646.1 signal recognition particle-docking protein FtsY [Pseudoflavonifractor hominis]